MERWNGKVAVVTGASSGIGANIAVELVKNGLLVVGLARRPQLVEELGKQCSGYCGKLYAYKCDVTKYPEIIEAFKWIKETIGPVAVLINNAGIYSVGTFAEGNHRDWRDVMETNVLGLAECSQLAVKQMREANIEGHIININSLAGHEFFAYLPKGANMYSPSKYAVTCMTEVMRREMAFLNTNIRCTSISPGNVDTDIADVAGDDAYSKHLKQFGIKTKDVTQCILYALSVPQHVDITEITMRPTNDIYDVS